MKLFNKKGFTFVELIVSIAISVIIFIIIFSFVLDSINNLSISNKKAQTLANLYDLYDTISNHRNEFTSGSLIIDNSIGNGSDVIIINNIHNDKGILFGLIDNQTMKIETGSIYRYYGYKTLGYKVLNLSEISLLQSNTGEVYNLSFNNSYIFDVPVKTFQGNFFNSGSIFLIDLELPINYNPNYNGKLWSDIPKSNIELFKLSFTF